MHKDIIHILQITSATLSVQNIAAYLLYCFNIIVVLMALMWLLASKQSVKTSNNNSKIHLSSVDINSQRFVTMPAAIVTYGAVQ